MFPAKRSWCSHNFRTTLFQLAAHGDPYSDRLNTVSLGDSRNFWADRRTRRCLSPGTTGALDVAENFLGQGLDVSAGTARSRVWDNHEYQLRDDFSWVKGKHNFQFGGGWRHIPCFISATTDRRPVDLLDLLPECPHVSGRSPDEPSCYLQRSGDCRLSSLATCRLERSFRRRLGWSIGGVIATRHFKLESAAA